MTVKSRTYYDQTAHNQPTQASEWAAENSGGGRIVDRTPERDAQLHRDNPGLMDQWLRQGSRSDGMNG